MRALFGFMIKVASALSIVLTLSPQVSAMSYRELFVLSLSSTTSVFHLDSDLQEPARQALRAAIQRRIAPGRAEQEAVEIALQSGQLGKAEIESIRNSSGWKL